MDLFWKVNGLCRDNTPVDDPSNDRPAELKQIAPYVQLAVDALKKLPSCDNDVLFRGLNCPPKYLKFQGTAKQFTSTSCELRGCYMKNNPDNVLVIYLGFGSVAKDISAISLYPSESECLISPLEKTIHDIEGEPEAGKLGIFDIDLSDVDYNWDKDIYRICFIRAPGFEMNKQAHSSFEAAVVGGQPLEEAVEIFKAAVVAPSTASSPSTTASSESETSDMEAHMWPDNSESDGPTGNAQTVSAIISKPPTPLCEELPAQDTTLCSKTTTAAHKANKRGKRKPHTKYERKYHTPMTPSRGNFSVKSGYDRSGTVYKGSVPSKRKRVIGRLVRSQIAKVAI